MKCPIFYIPSGGIGRCVFKKFTYKKLLKMVMKNPLKSRKEWLKMIFDGEAD
jgi:hypothetical protein